MRLNLTRTLGATALSGALLIGSVLGATTANAAENTPDADNTISADRLQGQVATTTYVDVRDGLPAPGAPGTIVRVTSIPSDWDAGWSVPAAGKTGEIRNGNICLSYNPVAPSSAVFYETCDNRPGQEFATEFSPSWAPNGLGFATTTHQDKIALTFGSTQLSTNRASGVSYHTVDPSSLSPVVLDEAVKVTGPSAGETVEGPRPTFSGTGEPGAEVVVTDGAGVELARTTVAVDGTWTVVSGVDVPDGPATAVAEQTINGDTTTDSVDYIVAALVDTPIVAPLVGLGALALAGVAAGGIVIRRKKTTQV